MRVGWAVLGAAVGVVVGVAAMGCGEPVEAPRHAVEVFADGSRLGPVETDLGYQVTLEWVEVWIDTVEFTVGGEEHGSATARWLGRLLPRAHAHPGHASGGEVAGELRGPVLARFAAGDRESLGEGEFLEGEYMGFNLIFGADETAVRMGGVVDVDGAEVEFEGSVELFPSARVGGGAIQGVVPTEGAVMIRVEPFDEWEGKTLFDGISFGALPAEDGVLQIRPGTSAGAQLVNAVLAHEFYSGAF